MDNEGCAGCVQQAILNRNQKVLTEMAAKKYADEKQVKTVVYFDGKEYAFCEETAKQAAGAINITGIYTPQYKDPGVKGIY